MGSQTDHETDAEGPIQNPLSENRPPHQRQVVAHPGEHRVTRQVLETKDVLSLSGLRGKRAWNLGRTRVRSHRRTSCQPVFTVHGDRVEAAEQPSTRLTPGPRRSYHDAG